jgi:hypothetical protein
MITHHRQKEEVMQKKIGISKISIVIVFIMFAVPLWAQTKSAEEAKPEDKAKKPAMEESQEELAKAAQNPVANMLSFPLQNNTGFNFGPDKQTQNITNFQPVIPISLGKEWNLITRTIFPIVYIPWPEYQFGLGNTQFTGFISPAKASKFIWGLGPVIQFPTHTDTWLGSNKWSAGPSAVGLVMEGHWVVGLLAQNIWSFAGPSGKKNPDVNQLLAQPFINYNLPKGWYLTVSPIITADWKAAGPDQWTVPLGGGVGKIFKIGKLPFNGTIQVYSNVVTPSNGPDWTIRAQLALLLPKSLF